MGGVRGDVGGARVGDGDRVGGTCVAGVGVANDIGVAVASFPPQPATKLSPSTTRNRADAGLFILLLMDKSLGAMALYRLGHPGFALHYTILRLPVLPV